MPHNIPDSDGNGAAIFKRSSMDFSMLRACRSRLSSRQNAYETSSLATEGCSVSTVFIQPSSCCGRF